VLPPRGGGTAFDVFANNASGSFQKGVRMNPPVMVGPKRVLYEGRIVKDDGPPLLDLLVSLAVQNTVGGYSPIIRSFTIDPAIRGSRGNHPWNVSALQVVIRGMWHPGDRLNWTIWATFNHEMSETLAMVFGVEWSNWANFEFLVEAQYSIMSRTGTISVSVPEGR